MPEEERRISPAIVIIPIGLGLGAAAAAATLYALARAAPPTPPPGLANLYGQLTDAETGAPLAGVSVGLWTPDGVELLASTTTDSGGSYLIEDILLDGYLVVFQKEGYETLTGDIVLVEGLNELNIQLVPIAPPGVVIDFPQLSILAVDGMPFASVVDTEATLAEPIVMSRMRGVSLTWLNKTVTPQPGFGMWWYLRYEPQFTAPMPPPGFALRPGAIPPVGQEAVAAILGCWAGGYYYPGMYDGVVTVSHMYGEYYATFEHSFRIKNLAQVTGTGTVVPPGY